MSSLIHKITVLFNSLFSGPPEDLGEDLLIKFDDAEDALSTLELIKKYQLSFSPEMVNKKKIFTFRVKDISSSRELVRTQHHQILKNILPPIPNEDSFEEKVLNSEN